LIRSLRSEFGALAHEYEKHGGGSGQTKFDNINQLMDKFCFADEEWNALSVFQQHQYSRVLLYSNEHFSVMLLCWMPGQRTPIHAHNADEMCWVRVVSGSLTHTLYQAGAAAAPPGATDEYNELMSVRLNSASGIARHKGMTPHAMANDTKDVRAVSIHVYSPTYLECCFFSGGLRRRIPFVYRALERLDDNDDVLQMAPSPSSSSSSSAAASDGDTPIYASLDELVATLRAELAVERAAERSPATIARVRALLEQFRFNQEEWQQYASFTSGAYTRNLIGYDEKFTLLLLCWPAGLASAIHDHAEASCWMKILSGRMRETRYAFPGDREPGAVDEELSLAVLKVTELGPEEAAYIDDSRGLHKMGNASPIAPSVSLHIYSPPFARCRVFDEATGATREVSLRGANACANPFMESDLGALALAPLGSTFRVPPSSPDAPPASVAELCARLRATFAAAVPKDVRNEQLCHLLNDARFAKQEWDEYVHFSERRYQRVLLAFDENFSLVLNCWHKQQATPVHRHHGVDAWMRVVAGELTLSHIAASSSSSSSDGATEPLAVQRLEPKHGATFFGAAALGLHRVANASDSTGAVSLHLYSPPLVNLRAHCTHTSGDDAMPPPSPDDVPVVYCAKALQPRAIDTQVARARSATAVFGNFQSFVSAIKHCLTGAAPRDGVSSLIAQYHFRPDEWMSYMNDDLSARTLIGLGNDFAVIMRFWPAQQTSAPHTHGDADCWVKVLHGCVENVLYERTADGLVPTATKCYKASNAGFAMDRSTIHSMSSVCCDDVIPQVPATTVLPTAVTLHVFVGQHADAVAFSADGSESRVDVSGMYRAQ
jgi:cysteine dioxygenase